MSYLVIRMIGEFQICSGYSRLGFRDSSRMGFRMKIRWFKERVMVCSHQHKNLGK